MSRTEQIDCGYRNGSDRMVILRCIGPDQFFLERVVFPFELLTFFCPDSSEVEIWTHGLGGPELLESIEAHDLVVESVPPPEPTVGGIDANPWLQAS
nr:DUF1830 domain-containing protein [Synechococcus sp. CCY 9618]